jgi:hypothetical protein
MTEQGTPTPECDLGIINLTLYLGLDSRAQSTHGTDTRPVLVSQRQMKQQVFDTADAQPVQLFLELRADAAKLA